MDESKDKVEAVLDDISIQTKALCDLVRMTFQAGAYMRGPDMLLLGVLKRVMSTSRGFVDLVKNTHFLCAAPLVRFQLDSALRFYGVLVTEDPHQAALDVIGGARIGRMRGSCGRLLSDRYLVELLSDDYPWVETVYRHSSDYVHLSSAHIFAPVFTVDDNTNTVLMVLTEEDVCAPAERWIELVECFQEVTRLVASVFESWLATHPNAPSPPKGDS